MCVANSSCKNVERGKHGDQCLDKVQSGGHLGLEVRKGEMLARGMNSRVRLTRCDTVAHERSSHRVRRVVVRGPGVPDAT